MKMVSLKSKNSQIYALDALVAFTLFATILVLSSLTWHKLNNMIYQNELQNDLNYIALHAINTLVKSPGVPANWTNVDEVKMIGLNNGSANIIDPQKVTTFVNFINENDFNYKSAKKLLCVGKYEFMLWIYNSTQLIATAGKSPPRLSDVAVAYAPIIIGNDTGKIIVAIWA